jgi:hypothetical protein
MPVSNIPVQQRAAFIESTFSNTLIKGEGDRGGKVIGHTKSGKPIYLEGGHSEKYNHQDHYEAHEHHAAITDDWRTRQKHYGKQDKKSATEAKTKHLKLSQHHSREADKDLKPGESRTHKTNKGYDTKHTLSEDGKRISSYSETNEDFKTKKEKEKVEKSFQNVLNKAEQSKIEKAFDDVMN